MLPRRRSVAAVVVASLWLGAGAARAADPVVVAAGDIACGPAETGIFPCQQTETSGLAIGMNPSAVLALGDNQYNSGSLADYDAFYAPSWGRLKSITHPVIGNHEYGSPNATGYFDYYNGASKSTGRAGARPDGWYSFTVGTWHVVALNTNCERVSCAAGSEQEQWLRNDLAAHPATCTLAFAHQPLWSSPTFEEPAVRPLFQALYDAGAELYVVGHQHLYDRFAPSEPDQSIDRARGVQQIIVGTGGRDLSGLGPEPPNSEERSNDDFGILRLTLHPSSYDWQFVPTSPGGFTDAGTRACHTAATAPAPQPAPQPQPSPAPAPQPSPAPAPAESGTLVAPAPALSPEDLEEPPDAALRTRLSVASVSIGRTSAVVRGRITTGATARRLRVTLSRRIRGRVVRITVTPSGGTSGAWRATLRLPRALRGARVLSLSVRYLGESGYLKASLQTLARRRR